jgi:hypothetical protein
MSDDIMVFGVKKMIATHNTGAGALAATGGKMPAKSRAVRPRHPGRAGPSATKRSQHSGQDLSRRHRLL